MIKSRQSSVICFVFGPFLLFEPFNVHCSQCDVRTTFFFDAIKLQLFRPYFEVNAYKCEHAYTHTHAHADKCYYSFIYCQAPAPASTWVLCVRKLYFLRFHKNSLVWIYVCFAFIRRYFSLFLLSFGIFFLYIFSSLYLMPYSRIQSYGVMLRHNSAIFRRERKEKQESLAVAYYFIFINFFFGGFAMKRKHCLFLRDL